MFILFILFFMVIHPFCNLSTKLWAAQSNLGNSLSRFLSAVPEPTFLSHTTMYTYNYVLSLVRNKLLTYIRTRSCVRISRCVPETGSLYITQSSTKQWYLYVSWAEETSMGVSLSRSRWTTKSRSIFSSWFILYIGQSWWRNTEDAPWEMDQGIWCTI